MERRGYANTARRAEDAERNQHRRALLLSFLSTLSHASATLDRSSMAGACDRATTRRTRSKRARVVALRRADREQSHIRPRSDGRTRARPLAPNNAWLNAEWRNLSEQLTVLASLRRQHHAADNRKRHDGRSLPVSRCRYRFADRRAGVSRRAVRRILRSTRADARGNGRAAPGTRGAEPASAARDHGGGAGEVSGPSRPRRPPLPPWRCFPGGETCIAGWVIALPPRPPRRLVADAQIARTSPLLQERCDDRIHRRRPMCHLRDEHWRAARVRCIAVLTLESSRCDVDLRIAGPGERRYQWAGSENETEKVPERVDDGGGRSPPPECFASPRRHRWKLEHKPEAPSWWIRSRCSSCRRISTCSSWNRWARRMVPSKRPGIICAISGARMSWRSRVNSRRR